MGDLCLLNEQVHSRAFHHSIDMDGSDYSAKRCTAFQERSGVALLQIHHVEECEAQGQPVTQACKLGSIRFMICIHCTRILDLQQDTASIGWNSQPPFGAY